MDLIGLQSLLAGMRGAKVLCVGDVMVDRFVYGDVGRISAEAPIPILARAHDVVMLGAAGNVARNAAALGANVALVGVVGGDATATEALGLLKAEAGVEGFLVTDSARPTTLKTRFVSAGQQLLRVDEESRAPIADDVQAELLRAIEAAAAGAGAILLSDYGKGVVTAAVIDACHAAAAAGARLVVDSKARALDRYGPVDVLKPNAAELAYATDLPCETDAEIEAALAAALARCQAKAILVTRAARGMSLAVRGGAVRHFRSEPPQVYDTSGAGDTALAALGAAFAAGASMTDAVELALLAASIVVQKAGTATASADELVEAEVSERQASAEGKIATPERMLREVAAWRGLGLKVGFTNGCFDILHRGHVAYLAEAKAWCDRLIVGLNSDRSVAALKGEGRPVNDLESRALVLGALGSVDLVVPFDSETPLALIEAARPDVLVKGADYAKSEVVGGDLVESWGGEVKLAPIVEGYSTTAAIARMSRSA
ncbi:MAG TPA: D-glycero-beta-D-manno-heptose 1-phosphate adenylyltransferase [Caulobacteraceae bacterium]|nr:D-glycero-beta-D-manno-heptose 1-phosphate adenylyltransferase [Caulobacteraceae bacterium]